MRALGKPKGHWRAGVWDAFVLEREEANAAVDKLPWVVQVVHQERVENCTVSRVREGPGWISPVSHQQSHHLC